MKKKLIALLCFISAYTHTVEKQKTKKEYHHDPEICPKIHKVKK